MRRLLLPVAVLLALLIPAAAAAEPTARFSATPASPVIGSPVTFDASESSCVRKPCTYRFRDLGPDDSTRSPNWTLRGYDSSARLSFTFTEPVVANVELTVRNRRGRTDSAKRRIVVTEAPTSEPTPEPTPESTPEPTPEPTAVPTPEPTPEPTPDPTPDPDPNLPPLGQPSCVPGSTSATSGAAIRSALGAGQNVCVTTAVGNIDLSGLRLAAMRTLGTTSAGSIGTIRIADSSNLTIQARFRSTKITLSDHITIQQSRIGGEPNARVLDMLVFVAEPSDDVTIRDNEIGWTSADNSGNTGYGIRVYNDSDNLTVQRNYIHHIGADAMQISISGENALIDRNEVAYAARPQNSSEHSDNLQMAGQGPNNRVTNNYFHHCGWFTEVGPTTGCNGSAIHAGSSNAFLWENNYEGDALGISYIGDLGTGGCTRSNTTYRRNTWFNNATQFNGTPDVRWGLCGGSNNLFERNLVISSLGNPNGWAASGTTARDNLTGAYELDASRDCTAAACNPAGQEPIGYRKPAGVHW